jgi:hypothetical protein
LKLCQLCLHCLQLLRKPALLFPRRLRTRATPPTATAW